MNKSFLIIILLFSLFYPNHSLSCDCNTYSNNLLIQRKVNDGFFKLFTDILEKKNGFMVVTSFCIKFENNDTCRCICSFPSYNEYEIKLLDSVFIYRVYTWNPFTKADCLFYEKKCSLDLNPKNTKIVFFTKPMKFDEKNIKSIFNPKHNEKIDAIVFDGKQFKEFENLFSLIPFYGILNPKRTLEIIDSIDHIYRYDGTFGEELMYVRFVLEDALN